MKWTSEMLGDRLARPDPRASTNMADDEARRWQYRMAAAVLASFDPWTLVPVGSEKLSEGEGYRLLVKDSQTSFDGLAQRWRLNADVRRAALQRLGSRTALLDALERNPDRLRDPLQQLLESYLRGESPSLQARGRDELSAMLQVTRWLSAVSDLQSSLPSVTELRTLILGEELLAPLRRLRPPRFVGRIAERASLDAFLIGGGAPLVIHGPGGVGKSALVAKLILDHTGDDARFMSFAYLDLETTQLDIREPVTLFKEIVRQLGLQLSVLRDRCSRLSSAWSTALAAKFVQLKDAGRAATFEPMDPKGPIDELVMLLGEEKAAGRIFLLVLDSFEEAQYRAGAWVGRLWAALGILGSRVPHLRIVVAGRAELPSELTHNALPIEGFDADVARAYLEERGLSADEAAHAARLVGGHPLSLGLAADLLERGLSLGALDGANVQGQLYARVLEHTQDPEVARLAHPGLALRRVTAELIKDVLAQPCEVEVPDLERASELFELLAREVGLFARTDDGALEHRRDLRRLMIRSLERDKPEQAHAIHQAAARWYASRRDARSRAEQIYHRLCLREDLHSMNGLFDEEVGEMLRDAVDELPPRQRAQLAARLGIELGDDVLRQADQEDWERGVAERVAALLLPGTFEQALSLLGRRTERLPRSPLQLLEARALLGVGRPREAVPHAERALEDMRLSGAPPREVHDVCMLLAEIHEAAGEPARALAVLRQAYAVAKGTLSDALVLRLLVRACTLAHALPQDGDRLEQELGRLADRASDEALGADLEVARAAADLVRARRPGFARRVAALADAAGKHVDDEQRWPSYLSTPKLDFSRPEVQELSRLLARVYRTPDAARRVLEGLGGDSTLVPFHSLAMRQVWYNVLEYLARVAKLPELIRFVLADESVQIIRPRLQEMLNQGPLVEAALPRTPAGTSITERRDWWRGNAEEEGLPPADADVSFPLATMRRIVQLSDGVVRVVVNFGGSRAYATGFLIRPQLILTCHYAVHHPEFGDAIRVEVDFDYEQDRQPTRHLARVLAKDAMVGVALLEVAEPLERPVFKPGRLQVRLDDTVVVIHHPDGGSKMTSIQPHAVRVVDARVLQYEGTQSPWSGGAPVMNVAGVLIGIQYASRTSVVGGRAAFQMEALCIEPILGWLAKRFPEFS